MTKRFTTYGIASQAVYRARNIRHDGMTTRFVAWRRADELGEVALPMPGAHNVENALGVLAIADFLAIPFDTYAKALAKNHLDEANKEVGNVDKLQKSLKKDPDAQNRKAIESRIAKLRPPATEHLDAANKEIAEVSKRKEAAENTAKQLQSEVEKYKNKRADLVKRAAALHIGD